MAGKIYLIPNTIAPATQNRVITPEVREAILAVDHYLVENLRSARRFIAALKLKPVDTLHFKKLDKHTDIESLAAMMGPLQKGLPMGIISEAGCPSVADPGSIAVAWAHEHDIQVIPLVGPSSILLALMASGMNGQSFEFHGYLPIDAHKRRQAIQALEKESAKKRKTQIFMETPYRNQALLSALIKYCHPNTKLCLACNLTAADQFVRTRSIAAWKKSPVGLHKKPTIFLLQT